MGMSARAHGRLATLSQLLLPLGRRLALAGRTASGGLLATARLSMGSDVTGDVRRLRRRERVVRAWALALATAGCLVVGLAVSPGASAFVYWINNTSTATIGRANLDGSSPNYSFITPPTRPQDITVDSSFIYLTNPVAGTVERVNLDGTGPVNTSFIPGGNGTFGVAV